MMAVHDWVLVAFGILQLTFMGLGLYFKQYLIKKADIKATNENFNSLKQQLNETTNLTKSIEHRIGNNAWLEQQRWTIRKEFYTEAVPLIIDISDGIDRITNNYIKSFSAKLSEKKQAEIDELMRKTEEFVNEKDNRLKYIVNQVGILFLDDSVIDSLNVYLNAEENRIAPLQQAIYHSKSKEEEMAIQAEIHSYDMHITTQQDRCKEAKVKLIEAAKLDLKIAWEN